LFSAWESLAVSGIQRLAILGDEDRVIDFISQSMLIDFLWQNIEKIGQVAQRLVKDFLVSPFEELETINEHSKAIVAFRLMVRLDKSGLAVVDNAGKLVDNISARDLKGIHAEASVFWRLWSTITEYKRQERDDYEKKVPAQVIYVHRDDTLFTVVEKMAVLHIHRVYVVDKDRRPTQVITQTDILREILHTNKGL